MKNVTEINQFQDTKKPRGGARPGCGRPKLDETMPVRIPVTMVDSVRAMAKAVRAGHSVEFRIIPAGFYQDNDPA